MNAASSSTAAAAAATTDTTCANLDNNRVGHADAQSHQVLPLSVADVAVDEAPPPPPRSERSVSLVVERLQLEEVKVSIKMAILECTPTVA
uniref:Uncharacterized protein n=1 Tax=Plectus sambesii TaxID=2011161 RepID=A0A914VDR8_9BILA